MRNVMSEELRFCQVVYFSSVRTKNWMEQFHRVALKYATELGRVLTHFELWPKDNKSRCSVLRYVKQNESRLLAAFTSEMYKGLSFYSLDKDQRFIDTSLYVSLVTEDVLSMRHTGWGRGNEMIYGTVLIDCALSFLEEHSSQIAFSQHFMNDINSMVDSGYGALIAMPWKKIPTSYFRNSTSYYLEPEEKQEVEIFRREGHRFQTIVRDVYWGNVLSRRHWGNDKAKEEYLLEAIEQECRGNVFWVDENTLFFCAPFGICPQDDAKMLSFKDRLYKVFDKCEIEVIRAHLDKYPEPQIEPPFKLPKEKPDKTPKKLRSKKKLIIRYYIMKECQETKEHKCMAELLKQAGPLPLTIRNERVQDDLLGEITVDGSKVPNVRKAVINCIREMNMDFEVNPPLDEED